MKIEILNQNENFIHAIVHYKTRNYREIKWMTATYPCCDDMVFIKNVFECTKIITYRPHEIEIIRID